MPQFKLRTMFLIVAAVALFCTYIVNFTVQRATCLLSERSGSGKVIAMAGKQEFFAAVIDEPGIKELTIFQNTRHPESWLQKRLEIGRIKAGSEVLRIDLIRYPYTESDNRVEDYSLILDAVLRVLQRDAGFTIDVLQTPSPPM